MNPPGDHAFPGGQVQDQFPNAMGFGDGMCGSSFGVDPIENFNQCGTVPGLAIEGALELVDDELISDISFSLRGV